MNPDLLLNLLIIALLAVLLMRSFTSKDAAGARLEAQIEVLSRQLSDLARQLSDSARDHEQRLQNLDTALRDGQANARTSMEQRLGEMQQALEKRHGETLGSQQETLQKGMTEVQKQVAEALSRYAEDLGKRVEGLTRSTDERLKQISGQVEKRLADGFEKTNKTFTDVIERLAMIDEAQKKITELSTNVVSLQEVLSDKRSRGAFGEAQLMALVANVMPEASFREQFSLSNGNRVDCMLFLPEPTGNVPIDAKFPLESYKRLANTELPESERRDAQRQFKIDIRKHISDISSRYIIPGETSDGAMMFIPAEAVFAEIHANHPDIVDQAHSAHVWMVSPTTLWAVLNTARAVLKDAATREQVHIIQEHLGRLAEDFGRFQKRMDKLATHIGQANDDVKQVHTSASKITSRFKKIEKVDLEEEQLEDHSLPVQTIGEVPEPEETVD